MGLTANEHHRREFNDMRDAPKQPPESVVDYRAWARGYVPPSEHLLIDQLAYRGARVICMSDWGDDGAFWVVMRGQTPSPAVRKSMRDMMELIFEERHECSPETKSPTTSPTTTEPVPVGQTATGAGTDPVVSTAASAPAGADVIASIGIPSKPEPGKN